MDPTAAEQLLADVDRFCTALRPHEELCYMERRYNDQLIPLARRHNILGMIVPEELGGRGADAVTYAAALARIGREGTGVRTFFSGHTSIGQYPIWRFGNAEQQQRYLPGSVTGENILAFGLTEPEAGSNPLEMESTYRREGDHYLLSGVKYLISNGGIATTVVAFAYPEQATGKDRRISAFLVDTAGETFQAEDLPAKPGMYTTNTAMFQMEDHPVPVQNLLGEEGAGFRIAMGTLISGRLSVAAGCLGVIEDCLTESIQWCQQRHQHGKPIGRHQLVQAHLAAIEMARASSALMVREAAATKDESDAHLADAARLQRADMAVAQAKLHASNAGWEAADHAVQIFGGRGWSELYRVGRHLQDIRVCRIYEGTDEIMKLKIATSLLGKEYAAFQ